MVGSFLNVVIYRLPIMMDREEQAWVRLAVEHSSGECVTLGESVAEPVADAITESGEAPFNLVEPRSSCPVCETPVKAWQNIPVISFLLLRGRCAGCGVKISARYPLIELLTGLLSALVAWRFGFGIACAGALLLTWSLIALTFIDFDRQLLPDRITLPLMWLGLCFSLLADSAGLPVFTDPRSSIIGAVAGYLSLWTVYQGFKLTTGKEGMGYGDFKLLAALGAWLGWQMLLLIIILAAGVGLIAAMAMMVFRGHDRQIPIPFGPYLAAAGFISLLWGPALMAAYLGAAAGT